MEPETAASGGWQAAIDPSLAARLLRPAVRPGVSDPHHGRTLAARLQRMAGPTLSDDVARRYGSTTLDAGGPPVVYAAPPIQAASMDSQRTEADPSGPLRKGLDAGRPVVQASERTTGPVFPPLRPPGAGAVQRMADPAAVRRVSDTAPRVQRTIDPEPAVQRMSDSAAVQRMADPEKASMPVAVAQRIETAMASGASTGSRGAERSVPGRPVVAPAPTRLQRQIAAEHAEAVVVAAPFPSRIHATRTAGGGGDGPSAAARAGERAAGSASPGPATAAAAIVQRRIDPAATHPPRVAGEREPEGTQPAAPLVVLAAPGGGEGAGMGASAGRAALPVAMLAGRVGGGGAGGGAIQAILPHPAEPWSPRSAAGGGGPSGARPVVAARSGGGSGSRGTAVQRMAMAAGAGPAPGGPATRMVHAAPAVVVQREAAIEPPAGAPPATLPTMTAGDAPGAGGAGGSDAAELSEQVYELLVRRLESERKQRGW